MKTVATILYLPPGTTKEDVLDDPEVRFPLDAADHLPAVGDIVTMRFEIATREFRVIERNFGYGTFGGYPERSVNIYVTDIE